MTDAEQPLFTPRTLVAGVIVLAAFVVLLHFMGRPWWCKHGFGLWSAAWTRCTSQHLLDPYAYSHVLHGIIFYWLLRPLSAKFGLPNRALAAFGLEVAWEVLENSPWVIAHYRQATAALDYTGDSILNAVGDVLTTVLGIAFAARFSSKAAVAVFIVFELWMLYLARYNLTLNVYMLLFPSETLERWQRGF